MLSDSEGEGIVMGRCLGMLGAVGGICVQIFCRYRCCELFISVYCSSKIIEWKNMSKEVIEYISNNRNSISPLLSNVSILHRRPSAHNYPAFVLQLVALRCVSPSSHSRISDPMAPCIHLHHAVIKLSPN